MYDVIIIGAGPAGLTCGLYARRAGLSALIIEKAFAGGQVTTTASIDNYPGMPGVSGFDLGDAMRRQVLSFDCEILSAETISVDVEDKIKKITVKDASSEQKVLESKTLVLATGAVRRTLNVPGESSLSGSGVSYCATCDGAFFKNRAVAVVGGGNTALEDALHLSELASRVYVIHRRDTMRGDRAGVTAVESKPNIEILYDTIVTGINGKFSVESLDIKNVKTDESSSLPVAGVFIAVGTSPQTELVRGTVRLDDDGYVLAGENCVTNIPGVYAAGDIRGKQLRQIVTAAADGAVAAHMAGKYIGDHFK